MLDIYRGSRKLRLFYRRPVMRTGLIVLSGIHLEELAILRSPYLSRRQLLQYLRSE